MGSGENGATENSDSEVGFAGKLDSEVIFSGKLVFVFGSENGGPGMGGSLGNCGCEQRDLGFKKERRRHGGIGEEVTEDLIVSVALVREEYEPKP